MSFRVRTFTLLLACALTLPASRSQEAPKAGAPPPDRSGEAYVVDENTTRWTFENDGSNTRDVTVRVRVQSDAGVQQFSVLHFPYQKANGTADIDYVRVRKPDGSTVVTPAEEAQDMPADVTREAPFYSDLREKQLPVKGLSRGDELELQFHIRQTKPLAAGQFWMEFEFPRDEVVLSQRLEVRVPRQRAVKLKSTDPQPVVSEEGAYRVYSWSRPNPVRRTVSKAELAQQAVRGRLPGPDVQLSSFQSWEEVGRWYDGLQRDRIAPTPEIREKAAELTRNAPDTAAKLRAIYKYVSTEFRYVGVDFGIGRYQPHAAAEVLNNQYGDCKDKHTLLAALLAAAGIPTYPALMNSRRALDPDVPSPGQFDHVITAVPEGNAMVWLDTTTEVAPFGYLATVLRNKSALVVFSDKPAVLEVTPADPPYPSSWTYKIEATLDDSGTLHGKVEQTFRGDSEVRFRIALRRLPQAQWKDLVQQISYVTGFAGEVSDVVVSAPEATDSPLRLSYTYTRKDYPDWKGRRISPPAPLFLSPPDEENGKLVSSQWLGAPGVIEFEASVQLPKGYSPELPGNKDLKEDFVEYHSSYAVEDGRLVSRYRLLLKQREVSGKQVEAYKAFVEKVSDDREQYILLSSGESETPEQAMAKFQRQIWDLPDSSDPEALQSERDAREALRRGALPDAAESLEEAVDQDPKFTRAWIFLGQVYMGTRQQEEGIEALRKAVASDPRQPIAYKVLAFALASADRADEAIQVWHDLAKVAPDDRDISGNLGSLLAANKRYREAVPYLETAVKLYPRGSHQWLTLGSVYLQTGEDDKALAAFDKVAELAPGPGSKNDIAYLLADAGKHLDLALRYAQEAVREVESASQKVRLDSLAAGDLGHTSALWMDWDTLGWVHYRLGHLKEAETYLAAAWSLAQDPVVGDHLGQVYEQEHRRQEAIHVYRLVASQASSQDRSKIPAFEDALARLRRMGVPSAPGNSPYGGVAELSKQRAIPLPRLVRGQASAEFFVLLAPGARVEATRFISGSEELRHAGNALVQARFDNTFPKDSEARVLRRGILGCYPVTGCSFVLLPPQLVSSVQ